MTAPGLVPASGDVVLGTAAPAVAGPRWRRLLVGLLLVVALGLLVRQAWPHPTPPPLDPDDPGPRGTRALVQVLRREGVVVDVVRTREQLAAAPVHEDTTLVTAASSTLTEEGLRGLADRVPGAGHTVLVGLDDSALATLDLPVTRTLTNEDTARAGASCTLDAARGAPVVGPVTATYRRLTAEEAAATDDTGDDTADATDSPTDSSADGATSTPGADGSGDAASGPVGSSWTNLATTGCYPVDGESGLLRVTADDTGPVDLLATASLLTNRTITTRDDAALALRLLGDHPRVLWYAPTADDVRPGDTTAGEPPLTPGWFRQLLVLLGGALLLTMWWRGRRLGPLAVEPLPVVVHAAETTLARGRLYRRAGGRAHAAAALRSATRRRLAERLGLARDADVEALVAAVAEASGRTPDAVRDLLAGPDPTTDAQLAQVAQDLAALEEGTRR